MDEVKDSTQATTMHIARVVELLKQCMYNLQKRAELHDKSKLESPEKAIFDVYTWKLKESTYGSGEYARFLREMQPALEHHYEKNPHHPEHYPDGIARMSLLDLLEMLCDWKAAGERHINGSMAWSLGLNQSRFAISPQLQSVLENTARELDWLVESHPIGVK